MPKQKIIPELEAEIAAKERQLAQLQHKQQQLETAAATMRKATAASGRTASSPAARPSKSVEPLAKVLSETEFYAFAEKAFALPEVKSLLMSAVNAHNAAGQKGKG